MRFCNLVHTVFSCLAVLPQPAQNSSTPADLHARHWDTAERDATAELADSAASQAAVSAAAEKILKAEKGDRPSPAVVASAGSGIHYSE